MSKKYTAVYEKKRIRLLFLTIAIIASYLIKFQGIFILPILLSHFLFIYPLSFKKNDYKQFYMHAVVISTLAVIAGLIVAWFITLVYKINVFEKLYYFFFGMYSYVANRGFNPLMIMTKLVWRIYQFSIFHAFFWYPAMIFILTFFYRLKTENKDKASVFIIYVAVCFFVFVFAAGSRLSVHYFIPLMPAVALLSARQILYFCSEKGMKLVFIQIVFTVLFFLYWHYRDLYIYTFNHNLKHNESKITEIFRIAVIGSYGEYLLPHKTLLPAIDYINSNYRNKTMLVWPMGTEIDYFTSGRAVVPSYWFNEKALFAIVQREKGDDAYIYDYEKSIIDIIIKHKPDLFVDVGSTDMIKKVMVYRKKGDPPYSFNIHETPILRLGRFAGLDDFPAIIAYLNTHYTFKGYFGKARIWVRR